MPATKKRHAHRAGYQGSKVVDAGDEASAAGSRPVGSEKTSSTLLERAQAGEKESRELLCRIYGPLVRNKYLAVVPVQDRDDLCQEVFLTLFRRISEFHKIHNDRPCFRPWLRKIASNKVGNYWKRGHRDGFAVSNSDLEALVPEADHDTDESDAATQDEQAQVALAAFEEALCQVERTTREAARRAWRENQQVDVVARDLGITTNAVRIAKCRVLARTRAILGAVGEPLEIPVGKTD